MLAMSFGYVTELSTRSRFAISLLRKLINVTGPYASASFSNS